MYVRDDCSCRVITFRLAAPPPARRMFERGGARILTRSARRRPTRPTRATSTLTDTRARAREMMRIYYRHQCGERPKTIASVRGPSCRESSSRTANVEERISDRSRAITFARGMLRKDKLDFSCTRCNFIQYLAYSNQQNFIYDFIYGLSLSLSPASLLYYFETVDSLSEQVKSYFLFFPDFNVKYSCKYKSQIIYFSARGYIYISAI